jgi:hypothetical protein
LVIFNLSREFTVSLDANQSGYGDDEIAGRIGGFATLTLINDSPACRASM